MLRNLFAGLIDIVYPKACVACKTKISKAINVDNLVCGPCWSNIKKNLPPFCRSCGRHLEKNNFTKGICPRCARTKTHFDRAFSPCAYEGTIKELIHEFKYKGKDYLGKTLGRILSDFIREYSLPIAYLDCVVPVPLHKTRLREREFNQAQILSEHIAREFKKSVLDDALIRNRFTQTQTELKPQMRFSNVKGSFSVQRKNAIENKNILLVDDVLTTSATASEAALALKNAGANIVFVLTLAN